MSNSEVDTTASLLPRRVIVEYKARSKMGDVSRQLMQLKAEPFSDDIGNIRQLDQALGEVFINQADASDFLEPLLSEQDLRGFAMQLALPPKLKGFEFHSDQIPVIMNEQEAVVFGAPFGSDGPELKATTSFVSTATATEEAIVLARTNPDIIEIWDSPPITHFDNDYLQNPANLPPEIQACPLSINLTKGGSNKPVGTIQDMLNVLNINKLHAQSIANQSLTGHGVTIGIMDFGISVNHYAGKVKNVTGGYPEISSNFAVKKWGTYSFPEDKFPHGNQVSYIASSIAPSADIHDYRIVNEAPTSHQVFLDGALHALQYALENFRKTGQPKIINCSWGMIRNFKNSKYIHDPNHIITRKFLEAIDAGMIIIFAAGNCGAPCSNPINCPSMSGSYHGNDYLPTVGPGASILGANGHPDVICVTGATTQKEYITYSSQGPAVLPPHRNPDICGVSHFKAYANKNFAGTSCAAPVISGIAALMVQKHPMANQHQIKEALIKTADTSPFSGPAANPAYTGYGLVDPVKALKELDRSMDADAALIG